MWTNSVVGHLAHGARGPSRHALVALLLIGSAACGESDSSVTGPPIPGTLVLATETSGFMQDDSYELFVNGESQGTIGANEELTIDGLDPATYEVTLGDVAANCVVDAASASVEVVSEATATVSMTVVCAPPEPTPYTIRANRDRPDLDAGVLVECSFGLCPSDDAWDIYAYFDSQSEPQSIIRQNQTTNLEIAHLAGVTLATLTEADVSGATFSTELLTTPFATTDVVLVKTQSGSVYALGNPDENTLMLTLTFDAVLIASP